MISRLLEALRHLRKLEELAVRVRRTEFDIECLEARYANKEAAERAKLDQGILQYQKTINDDRLRIFSQAAKDEAGLKIDLAELLGKKAALKAEIGLLRKHKEDLDAAHHEAMELVKSTSEARIKSAVSRAESAESALSQVVEKFTPPALNVLPMVGTPPPSISNNSHG